MTSEAQVLHALMHALVDRDGTERTRKLMPAVAALALRPPATNPSPEAWHTGDDAFAAGSSRLVDELLATVETRKGERVVAAAMTKTTKKGTP